jgi:hypothetical protein
MTNLWYRFVYIITLLLSFLTSSSNCAMVGGFSEIEKPEENPMLQGVTEYVQTQLPLQSQRYSFDCKKTSEERLRVVQSFQQVVAGMNYRILYAVENTEGKLKGAFKVQVYDRFGDVSVTTWDDEVSVSEVSNILAGQSKLSSTDFKG